MRIIEWLNETRVRIPPTPQKFKKGKIFYPFFICFIRIFYYYCRMELITTYICKKGDIGVHDNMFGGTLVSLIDDASAAYAAQICDTPRIVTIMIDQLVFKKPVKVNNLLKIYGKVLEFGKTSLSLYIEVRKHNVHTGTQEIVTYTNIKFVRIDEEGNPIPISSKVKQRYFDRVQKYNKGLLTPEEMEFEALK
jgi:acyl-CoA thioesterase YciA